MPRGRPTTSTERMRLKKLRDQGKADPVKTCSVCGKTLKKGASGASKAWHAGLCYEHWKQTDEAKQERRAKKLKQEFWGIGYFSGEPLAFHPSIKKAMKAAGRDEVYVVWNDGRVTIHCDLTFRTSVGLTPESGDQMLEGFEELQALVPDELKDWFES